MTRCPACMTKTSAVLRSICSDGALLKLVKLTPDEASMPTMPAVVMLELVALATTLAVQQQRQRRACHAKFKHRVADRAVIRLRRTQLRRTAVDDAVDGRRVRAARRGGDGAVIVRVWGGKESDQAGVLAARQSTADRGLGGFVDAVDTVATGDRGQVDARSASCRCRLAGGIDRETAGLDGPVGVEPAIAGGAEVVVKFAAPIDIIVAGPDVVVRGRCRPHRRW